MDPDKGVVELQRKVMFDIRYYMCRRGNENIKDMTKSTFNLCFDQESGISYIKKIEDEMTKNHKERDTELISGFIPQVLNADGTPHKLCPVRSYENYINLLNEKLDNLWQKVNTRNVRKGVMPYFNAVPVGKNPHSTFMSDLSELLNLSKRYTNHSIRVTGTTNLTRAHYTARQIMSVTGHKSIQSLSIYQRVKEDEKMMMGMSLMYSLLRPGDVAKVTQECSPHFEIENENMLALPAPPTTSEIQPKIGQSNINAPTTVPSNEQVIQNSETAITPYMPQQQQLPLETAPNFDLLELLCDGNDTDLVMAATQVESEVCTKTSKTHKWLEVRKYWYSEHTHSQQIKSFTAVNQNCYLEQLKSD